MVFQLTASQGGWQELLAAARADSHFNSQPHKEADSISVYIWQLPRAFQLTASQGGWHRIPGTCHNRWKFQLTASQGGWLQARQFPMLSVHISTHSLTRRLTLRNATADRGKRISTHSLTRRLTGSIPNPQCTHLFQLTASQGGWLLLASSTCFCLVISTHSLTRRLTAVAGESDSESDISTHSLTRRLTTEATKILQTIAISTHSLTRRLTIQLCYICQR